MTDIEKTLSRVAFKGPLEPGADGRLIDGDGRLICTINLKELTLTEAWAFAVLFCTAMKHPDALIAAEREATR